MIYLARHSQLFTIGKQTIHELLGPICWWQVDKQSIGAFNYATAIHEQLNLSENNILKSKYFSNFKFRKKF